MSNIEPTEEQRRASILWYANDKASTLELPHVKHWIETGKRPAAGLGIGDELVAFARLLAEREAKLRKQLTFMEAGSLADYNAFAEALQKEDAYLAEINLINERLAEMREVDGRKSRMLYDRDVVIDTLRARIKELEAACGERLAKLGEAYEEAETGWLGDIKELEEREAKLREEVARLEALCTEEARLIVERDTLRARVAELEAVVANSTHDQLTEVMLEAREAQHLARIAELEQLDLDRDRALYLAEGEYFAASAREAQHLADIKALATALKIARTWIFSGAPNLSESEAEEIIDEAIARLAHYDDAKADAPRECGHPCCGQTCGPREDRKADAPARVSVRCRLCGPVAPEHFRDHDDVHKEGGEG